MEPGDDDERANAYQRYIFHQFADIVQHYDDTARPDHDDINYDSGDLDKLDGAEYDNNGDPVAQYGLVFIIFRPADDDAGFDDDRFDDDSAADRADRFFDAWAEADDYLHDSPPDNRFRYPLYHRRRGVCKRPRDFFYGF